MITLPRSTPALFIAGTAVALALTGCTGGATTADPDASPSGEATGGSDGSGGDTEIDQSTCLIGDWRITQDQMQVFYDAVGAESGGGLTMTTDGDTGLSFTETSYTYTPDFTLTLTFDAGIDGTGTITGSIRGDYEVAGGVIATSHNESDVSMTVDVGGVEMDGSDLFGDILASHPFNEAPYECTADEVVIQFSTGDGRVPVALTPAS